MTKLKLKRTWKVNYVLKQKIPMMTSQNQKQKKSILQNFMRQKLKWHNKIRMLTKMQTFVSKHDCDGIMIMILKYSWNKYM